MNKSAFVTIIGRANVGKSSLMNCIIGQKIAIVSDKPQTTRTRIMGVYTRNEEQMVFIDTPGFHKPKTALGQNMIKAVSDGLSDVDAVLLVVEAQSRFECAPTEIPPAEVTLIEQLKKRNLKTILVINKIDLLKTKDELLELISKYTSFYDFSAVVPISARKKDGIDLLLSEISKFSKQSPHFFSSDDVTDQPDKVMVAEIIREKLLHNLDKEVPHGIAVDIEKFVERDRADGQPIIDIEATIYCERDSHKGIIIGKKGALLKKIGTHARYDIERFFGVDCSVKLWVKVKEDWRNRAGLIHNFGLD